MNFRCVLWCVPKQSLNFHHQASSSPVTWCCRLGNSKGSLITYLDFYYDITLYLSQNAKQDYGSRLKIFNIPWRLPGSNNNRAVLYSLISIRKAPQAFLFHVSGISIYFRQLFYLFPSRFHLEKIRIYLKYEIDNTTVLLKIEKY